MSNKVENQDTDRVPTTIRLNLLNTCLKLGSRQVHKQICGRFGVCDHVHDFFAEFVRDLDADMLDLYRHVEIDPAGVLPDLRQIAGRKSQRSGCRLRVR